MRQLDLVAQTSLDGFVAGLKGEFDNFIGGEENLEFVCSIIDDADTALLGRISYELLNADWPTAANKPEATKSMVNYSNWYNAATKIVVSTTLHRDGAKNTIVISDHLSQEINKIKQQEGKGILVFGSPSVVHSLLESDLVDNIWIIVHPVIFGSGIPLFKNAQKLIKLELITSKKLSNGTLCNKYAVLKSNDF
ncbi:MAG: dihydrofolate reductase family protein [Sphingobacteriales bacterium]|nr:dihydrofolate reductase family protein [Sphingobacteriales bacterium]